MVYVNSRKFACESCIKGHRSSHCHHTDRPLFEIKKKGRPVSQCEKCRELRNSKRMHSKCTCNDKNDHRVELAASSSGAKTRRFIPIAPALPNGIKDLLSKSNTAVTVPADTRQRVDSLLNPCNCKDVWKCNCILSTQDSGTHAPAPNLETLARAAETRCCEIGTNTFSPLSPSPQTVESHPGKQLLSGSSNRTLFKGLRSNNNLIVSHPDPVGSVALELPPILISESSSQAFVSSPIFENMPSMSIIASLAGSGCTCGVLCACPGCVEHRVPAQSENPATKLKLIDCASGCTQCVDHSLTALPGSEPSYTGPIDMFFATMASIPPPPNLDNGGYSSSSVALPKLECCAGKCGCPNGRCACRTACSGCCADNTNDDNTEASRNPSSAPTSDISPTERLTGSCCSREPIPAIP